MQSPDSVVAVNRRGLVVVDDDEDEQETNGPLDGVPTCLRGIHKAPPNRLASSISSSSSLLSSCSSNASSSLTPAAAVTAPASASSAASPGIHQQQYANVAEIMSASKKCSELTQVGGLFGETQEKL